LLVLITIAEDEAGVDAIAVGDTAVVAISVGAISVGAIAVEVLASVDGANSVGGLAGKVGTRPPEAGVSVAPVTGITAVGVPAGAQAARASDRIIRKAPIRVT
jgi:hypothetical protein